jgi:cyclopropane fatty-acyl-phospholipid synthase-like methyltransferase
MLELFQPKTVLDLGCGTGRSLEYLLDHGVDAMGVEGSALAISKARNSERIVRHDLVEATEKFRNLGEDFCENMLVFYR